MALPIWALYMQKAYVNKDLEISTDEFEKPKDLSIIVDCDKNKNPENEGVDKNIIEEDPEF